MSFFDQPDNVEQYLAMTEDYDGAFVVAKLAEHAPAGATVLELGMGPGKDLDLIAASGFRPTGSDLSQVFLDRYRERGGERPTVRLDAVAIETDQQFDVVFTNKVLQHLEPEQLRASLARQAEVVRPGGLAVHMLWYGEDREEHHGLLFVQHTEDSLRALLPPTLELVASGRYTELEDDDSLWVVLRRSSQVTAQHSR